ncbi:exodeoxyribonuclease VIII-like protein, partial [Pectobacterium polaris]|uniref:exodeoxyribonuclease VIII-like protein n=1 Tax=Pectobacterium polaris TaxID=2042057 RepID=UPI0032E4919D
EDAQAQKPLIAGLDRERQYTHTHRTLNREVALFIANDNIIDPWEVTEEQKVAGDQVMKSGGDTYSRWSTELSMVEGALKIPRPIVFILINEAKKRPELLLDANARQRFVVDFLAEHMPSEIKVESMGAGRFSIDGLTSESTSNQSEKTEVASATNTPNAETKQPEIVTPPAETITQGVASSEQVISDSTAQQAKEALDQLGYGVYAEKPEEDRTIDKSVGYNESPAPAPADDFQQRAEAIEADIAKKTEVERGNLSIWQRVQRTDPARTKRKETWKGFGDKRELVRAVTSVNPTYQIMRATEIFGPFGLGWGVDIAEERFDPGLPLMEPVFDSTGREINRKPMRDSDGSLVRTQNHTMQIKLWYLLDGNRGEIPAFGHTKYLYATNSGGMVCDDEVGKKSLTDAITKGLSALGFSADVYMGLFDDGEYAHKNEAEFGIKNASDKAEDVVRLRAELDEKFTKNAATMEAAVSIIELNKIHGTIAREMETHRKNAEAIGDGEYERYLSGRLRRLNEIKEGRAKALKANEGEKA